MWIATAYNNDDSKKVVPQISAEPIAKSDEEFLFFCDAGLRLSINLVALGLFLFFRNTGGDNCKNFPLELFPGD